VVVARKVGRNEPCTCGSGKKFKKCCQGRQPTLTLKRAKAESDEQKRAIFPHILMVPSKEKAPSWCQSKILEYLSITAC